jgi:hypothetical protein
MPHVSAALSAATPEAAVVRADCHQIARERSSSLAATAHRPRYFAVVAVARRVPVALARSVVNRSLSLVAVAAVVQVVRVLVLVARLYRAETVERAARGHLAQAAVLLAHPGRLRAGLAQTVGVVAAVLA